MNMHLRALVPGAIAATALALAVSAGAQTPPPAAPSTAAKSPRTTSMTGHHRGSAATAKHTDAMKAECESMMAKKQEMQDKMLAMDATLDKLVAEMNAAKASKDVGALERPMAAVLNELVAQRKASRSMMMEMHHGTMAHMDHHMHMNGGRGGMDCPMMKTGMAPAPNTEESTPKS